jgi:hypothetical protein
LLRIFDRAMEIGMPDRFNRGLPLGIETHQIGQHLVGQGDAAAGVGHHDRLGHGIENRLKTVFTSAFLLVAGREPFSQVIDRARQVPDLSWAAQPSTHAIVPLGQRLDDPLYLCRIDRIPARRGPADEASERNPAKRYGPGRRVWNGAAPKRV